MKENEGELALFLKMKKHEKECNDLLLNCSEEFNAPLAIMHVSLFRVCITEIFVSIHDLVFIYDLPNRLSKCIKLEAYADAIRAQMKYLVSLPLYQAYGDSSFRDCKQASVEVIVVVVKNLHGKLFSDFESIQVRAYATVLLKQLDFSVCTSFLKK
ncbi:Vacuolar protein sorting-associated protein 51 [Glycine max]|nr:Vacuolar protein sorting-associated protein 51 [Glycine max]